MNWESIPQLLTGSCHRSPPQLHIGLVLGACTAPVAHRLRSALWTWFLRRWKMVPPRCTNSTMMYTHIHIYTCSVSLSIYIYTWVYLWYIKCTSTNLCILYIYTHTHIYIYVYVYIYIYKLICIYIYIYCAYIYIYVHLYNHMYNMQNLVWLGLLT